MGPDAASAASQAFWPTAKTLMPGHEIIGVPARRKPGGAAHAAQNAEALFCHFTFSMHEAYQPT